MKKAQHPDWDERPGFAEILARFRTQSKRLCAIELYMARDTIRQQRKRLAFLEAQQQKRTHKP